MDRTSWCSYGSRFAWGLFFGLIGGGGVSPAAAQTQTPKVAGTRPDLAPETTVESLFADFLHFARMGRFDAANAYAQKLLAHPDLDPVELLEFASRDRKSVDTLLIIIKNSSIGENARQVLELLEKGEYQKRKDPERIQANIENLGGNPQQEASAIRHLAEGGEYAVPPLVEALLDPSKAQLWPRIILALPQLGKGAVNPMVIALAVNNNDVRQNLIHALGEIGYPQAIAYLRKLTVAAGMSKETQAAADQAIARIEALAGRAFPGAPQELFYQLAERYYDEDDAVRADPRLEQANVWYWEATSQALQPVVVPQRIFGPVMAMRCCEEALLLRNDHPEAIALWLAANIRREGRLGMNVESGDASEVATADPTRPTVFPRALYFTQAAGPRYAHLVLDRAVRNHDSAVALGAIEALRVTAGEASLVGNEDLKQPLAQALRFPDLVVRIRAALALGAALPKSQFPDAQFVVPVLAGTLTQSGRRQVLVVDADEGNGNRVMGALRGDFDVIGAANFDRGLDRVRTEFQSLAGVYLSTDLAEPDVKGALKQLRGEFTFAKTPIVVLAKPRQSVAAEEVVKSDPCVQSIDAAAGDADLKAALSRAAGRAGQAALEPELAKTLALQAAETLRRIAVDGRTVYDVGMAVPALIAALGASDERLQTTAASVLALAPSPQAQRAIAHVALTEKNAKSLRVAAFDSLAESAKNHGNLLEENQITELVRIAREDSDLTIRTAASQTLGAINLANNKASEILRSYHRA